MLTEAQLHQLYFKFSKIGISPESIHSTFLTENFQDFYIRAVIHDAVKVNQFVQLFQQGKDSAAYLNATLEHVAFWQGLFPADALNFERVKILVQASWLIKKEEVAQFNLNILEKLNDLKGFYLNNETIFSILSQLISIKNMSFSQGVDHVMKAFYHDISWDFFEKMPGLVFEDVMKLPVKNQESLYQLKNLSEEKDAKPAFNLFEWVLEQWPVFRSLYLDVIFPKEINLKQMMRCSSSQTALAYLRGILKTYYMKEGVLVEREWGQLAENKRDELLKHAKDYGQLIKNETLRKSWLLDLSVEGLQIFFNNRHYFQQMSADVPQVSLVALLIENRPLPLAEDDTSYSAKNKFNLLVKNHQIISNSSESWESWLSKKVSKVDVDIIKCLRDTCTMIDEEGVTYSPSLRCFLLEERRSHQACESKVPLFKNTYI